MKKKIVWILLILLLIGVLIIIFLKPTKEEIEGTPKEKEGITKEDGKEELKEEYTYSGDTDFSSFSTEEQIVGEESEQEYAILGLQEKAEDGYHEFVFSLQEKEIDYSKEEKEASPFVSASYLTNTGSIRISFENIMVDSSGIGYLQEKEIAKDGVLKIYHNISSHKGQEVYDIGISQESPFNLTSKYLEDGKWEVNIKVKYSGESRETETLEQREYSRKDQKLGSIGAGDNARITGYSYGRPAGLLKFAWDVNGEREIPPIPFVESFFNDDGDLEVVFDSLSLDKVISYTEDATLSSGITVKSERIGEKSIYIFSKISANAEYRISTSLSPYQVILEIK